MSTKPITTDGTGSPAIMYLAVGAATWRLVWVLWRNWRADMPPLDIESRERR